MSRITYYLNNQQLAHINHIFTTIKPGYQQRVELIYTRGKSDQRLWRSSLPGVKAITPVETTTVRDSVKFLNALVVVDLLKAGHSPRMEYSSMYGKWVIKKAGLKDIKLDLFGTVVHELQHVLQGWVYGEDWIKMTGQARLSKVERYEVAAENVANSWIHKKFEQVKAGEFDYLLPIRDVERLVK